MVIRAGVVRRSRGGLIAAVVIVVGIAGCGGGGGGGGGDDVEPEPLPGSSLNELNVTITDVTIDADRKPVVTYVVGDSEGNPRTPVGLRTRFVIAVRQENGEFHDYITGVQTSPTTNVAAVQAGFEDSARGTLEDLGGGGARYTFSLALPAGYDAGAVHRLALFADTTVLGVAYVSNAIFDFVPSSGPVDTPTSDVVRTENCNGCHDPLEAHGGTRRDVRLCVTCHSSQITNPQTGETVPHIDPDTGHTIGFNEMIHKIHRGENLPSVEAGTPYQIIGFNQGVNDYSHVVFPQDIRNCETCHGGAVQGDWFMTRPTREACGSCHDDVNFASGEGHGGGAYEDDFSCSSCHLPQGEHEFDISVVGSHVIPAHSQQAPGVRAQIVRVTSLETGSTTVAPGEHPVVDFRLTTTAGSPIDPSSLNALTFTLAGPTREYAAQDYDGDGEIVPGDPASPWTPGAETFQQASPRDAEAGSEPGVFSFAFESALPMNAIGTYAVGVEGYECTTIDGAAQRNGGINCSGDRDTNGNGREDAGEVFDEIRDAIPNVVFYFAVTDPAPVPRRTAVTTEQCSVCHGIFSKDFSVHGNNRNSTEYCALCHNPSNDTLSRQLPDVGVTAMTSSVDFKIMIHKIHRGENLTMPYLLYGRLNPSTFPNHTESPIDFSELLFPGDLRDCEACHLPETYVLEPGRGVLGDDVRGPTTRTFVREERSKTVLDEFTIPPTIAVCTSCHDDVHFDTGENHPAGPAAEDTCDDCHGVGRPLSVERTHFLGLAPEDRIHRPN